MKSEALPSTSTEDYLERIHELIEQKGYARAVDIAEVLEISQPLFPMGRKMPISMARSEVCDVGSLVFRPGLC